MNKSTIVDLLCEVNCDTLEGIKDDPDSIFLKKYENLLKDLYTNHPQFCKQDPPSELSFIKDTSEWKYIEFNFLLLELLDNELSKHELELLSVQEMKNIKTALKKVATLGIANNLQPKLPLYTKISCHKVEDILNNYNLLKYTIRGFCDYLKRPNLRMLIIPHLLQLILVGLLQLSSCPIKKPSSNKTGDKFTMMPEVYEKLLLEQGEFSKILDNLRQNIFPIIFVKEIMVLLQPSAPGWMKKSISTILSTIIRSKKGVKNITLAMLDGDDDMTKSWKTIDVLTKIIMDCHTTPDFKDTIGAQLISLIDVVKSKELSIFERLFSHVTMSLYQSNQSLSEEIFLKRILSKFMNFAYEEYKFGDGDDVTHGVTQTVRLLHTVFVDNTKMELLPVELLKPISNVALHFYHFTVGLKTFNETNDQLRGLLRIYLRTCDNGELTQLFDSFFLKMKTDGPRFREDIILHIDQDVIKVELCDHRISHSVNTNIEAIVDLLNVKCKMIVFEHYFILIFNREKYFRFDSNDELMGLEDKPSHQNLEQLLTIHQLLLQIVEDKEIKEHLTHEPEAMIKCINNVLVQILEIGVDKFTSTSSELLFLVVMILENLVLRCDKVTLISFKTLLDPLTKISREINNVELKQLCGNILKMLRGENVKVTAEAPKELTDFDKALMDICDPLLPVRGHALLALTKLVEKKDENAMKNKQYLLNLFQMSLKDEDSFIYLNAVQGLVALADVFPDTVVQVLCDEYTHFTKKSSDHLNETRMKLGEVLVRVIKLLGEMAPVYKALLLNTFLLGTRDEDCLIRASSLSNLGEICRVLGYKLGTIITEVLVCVHAVIATDKSPEARRAAVSVIRQILVGLGSEMISFLKEEILPIYRTLKEIYQHDNDEVMKLQAQLALEEINAIMTDFVFPKPELNMQKNIIMFND